MLRDLPPFIQHDSVVFMNSSHDQEGEAQDHQQPSYDPLDDVFGSAPSSPILSPSMNNGEQSDSFGHGNGNTEYSDVPRLRRIHVTNGYREGIAVSKEEHIQAGFDEGFSLGGEIGMRAGWCLGALEGIHQALSRADMRGNELVDRARDMYAQAKESLVLDKLLGEEHFGPDGIWKYDVPGQDDVEDLGVTFADVAMQHPVLKVWRERVFGMAAELGMAIGGGD